MATLDRVSASPPVKRTFVGIATRLGEAQWLLAALALSLLMRIPLLSAPMISDEGSYAYVARQWLRGDGELYRDLWISRPQGILVVYGLILQFGDDVVVFRAAAWLAGALTIVAVWWLTRLAFGSRAASLAAILFALLSGSPYIEGFTANAEVFSALPAAVAAGLLFQARLKNFPLLPLTVAGALIGAATLLKPSSIVMLPVVLVFVTLVAPHPVTATVRRWLSVCSGFAFVSALAVIHGYMLGWSDFWFATVGFRSRYQSAASSSLDQGWAALNWLLAIQRLLLLAIGVTFYALMRTRLRPSAGTSRAYPENHGMLLVVLWIAASLVGIAMGGDWWPHYLIQAAAPVAIWMAVTLTRGIEKGGGVLGWVPILLVTALLLAPYDSIVLYRGDGSKISNNLYASKYASTDAVASYIRTHTEPETPIYVAFSEPEVYFMADRPAAFRFLYGNEIVAYPDAYASLMALIESPDRPQLVLDLDLPCRCLYPDLSRTFWAAIDRHYHLETTVDGIDIYRAN